MSRCKIFNSEFQNYYKIAIHDHLCVSNFGVSDIPEQMPQNKYQVSYLLPSDFPGNLS